MNKKQIRVPVILGPTAVGKTEISLHLASELDFEILSCDSRQIYRYLDIGTAKPSRVELETVHHWMIDIVDPSDSYSAYRFAQDDRAILRNDPGEAKTKLICGGTGMYFNTLCEGIGPQVASNSTFRKVYQEKAANKGKESIFRELRECDPETASRLHPNDVQRVIRALQVYHETGQPLSVFYKKNARPEDITYLIIILSLPRKTLYDRINKRVDAMVSQGLWEEFRSLQKRGYTESDPGLHCVGYKELFKVLSGEWSLSQAVEKIKQNSRNYAKRQMTWFSNKTDGIRIDLSGPDAYAEIREKIRFFLAT